MTLFINSPLSPSAERHTCREGSCTQTAILQLSSPLLCAWCEAHEPTSQRASGQSVLACFLYTSRLVFQTVLKPVRIQHHSACLSLVGVQLTADSVGPAELLLQLAGALHVHSVALLQEAHLSAQVSKILQLPLVRLH